MRISHLVASAGIGLTCALALVACKQGSAPQPDAAPASDPDGANGPGEAGAAPGDSPHGGGKAPAAAPHGNPHAPHAKGATTPPPGPPRDITPSGETRPETLADLTVQVPKEWERRPPASRMRLAEFVLPGPGGDATLAVFRFPGGGGTVQANIDRWVGQFEQPDGTSSKERARTETRKIGGLELTTLDLTGTFKGMAMPGAPGQPALEGARMLAAVLQGHGDAFFLKTTGPAATLDVWAEAWSKALDSIEVGAPGEKPETGPQAHK